MSVDEMDPNKVPKHPDGGMPSGEKRDLPETLPPVTPSSPDPGSEKAPQTGEVSPMRAPGSDDEAVST